MANSTDVLVIGGGIIGLTSAYYLAKAGLSVEVVDRGAFGQEASWAGAGIIPPGNPDHAATPLDKLRAIGSQRFPELSKELHELTGMDNGYLRCGGIEFLAPEDEDATHIWRTEGIWHERLADPSALEPAVRPIPGTTAYHFPDCAQVRNPWHLRALVKACYRSRVRMSNHTRLTGWNTAGGKVSAALASLAERSHAGAYVIASGAWASETLEHLGRQLPVHPVRGQIVLFRAPRPLFNRVLMAGKRYLVPRADGRVLSGSTEEPDAGFVKANTPQGVDELTRFAHGLVPELAGTVVEKAWSGLRPGSPDGMPFIGPVPGYSNVFTAVGHFRAGVQLSIGTAELVRDLITGAKPALADAFRLDRVPDVTARPAFRS